MKITRAKSTAGLRAFTSSALFRVGLGIVVSVLTLWLAARNVSIESLQAAFTQANLGYVGLALLVLGVSTYAKAVRWKILVGSAGQAIPLSKYFAIHVVGQMLNILIPARVGDLSRAYVLGGMGPGRAFTLGTIVIEKFLDMVGYALIFVLLLLLMPLPAWVYQSAAVLAIAGGVVVLLLAVLAFARAWFVQMCERLLMWLPEGLRTKVLRLVEASFASLHVLRQRNDLFWLIVWTAVVWVTAALINYSILLALNIDVASTAPLLLLVALQAGITIPSAPGKIGVFEWICERVLVLVYGIASVAALSYGILLHTVTLVPIILLGLILFWQMGLSGTNLPREQD
ncbi:MAG: flippase-like domain-containing protein [Chloroflexaceae bacterium]|nr:flippase-like domain-containing protein [Chloroflexaceae bacterium]